MQMSLCTETEMNGIKNNKTGRRITKRLYKFGVNQVTKIEPTGNRRAGTKYPEPRSGHRIVIYNGNIYAFGGFNPNLESSDNEYHQVLFKELWRFNFAARNWTKLETSGPMPDELASHAAVLVNNNMFVYGGTGVPFGESSSNSTHVCNLDKLEWKTLSTTGYLPLELYGQAIAVQDGKMYVIGGTSGFTYSMAAHCLNLAAKEWTLLSGDSLDDLPNEPEPRYRHEIAIYDNQIFVFGGGTANQTYGFKEIPVFSLTDLTWKFCPTSQTHPAARKCHGMVQNEKYVFICGGLDGSTIYSDIWRINLETLQWKKLKAKLPTNLYFHSTALSQAGQIIIFGGVSDQNTRTNELFSIWIKVPSLTEICWQAILNYVPHIALLDEKKLAQEGIPNHFIKQIEFLNFSEMENNNGCNLLS